MNACIYIRTNNNSPADAQTIQQAACENYALKNGLKVSRVYSDVGSGIVINDGLNDLLAAARHNGFNHVIIDSVCRFTRNVSTFYDLAHELKQNNISLHIVNNG